MSLRALPALDFPAAPGVQFDIPPLALAKWDMDVQAASAEDTISILEPIGDDGYGGGVTVKRIQAALRSIGEKPVTVQINSPGGNYFDGLAIYNALATHPKRVTVQILGMAASAASVIAMAGDVIEIAKAAFIMIHNTQWIAIGDRHVMTDTAAIMEKFDASAAGLYADRTGLDAKAAAKLMDAETFMAGPEAVEKGFADALMAVDPAKPTSAAKQSLVARMDAALARTGVPRNTRRDLMKDLIASLPSAVGDPAAAPSAGDPPRDFGGFLAELRAFKA